MMMKNKVMKKTLLKKMMMKNMMMKSKHRLSMTIMMMRTTNDDASTKRIRDEDDERDCR